MSLYFIDRVKIMLANFIKRVPTGTTAFGFATTVTRDAVDYYQTLEVPSSATESAIRQAYAQLTNDLKPELDKLRYRALNEAFVILTDNKTRDAYDSLLGVRKSFYLSPDEEKSVTKLSYIATRKANKDEELRKRINIDEFGRYQGGLPKKNGERRGKSLGETGVMYRQHEVEEELDRYPEFNNITKEKAESFKDFHQDERKARTMKWPWFTSVVDYEYFTFRTFRTRYWPKIQFLIFFFYVLPVLYYTFDRIQKKWETDNLKAKATAKAQKAEPVPESQE